MTTQKNFRGQIDLMLALAATVYAVACGSRSDAEVATEEAPAVACVPVRSENVEVVRNLTGIVDTVIGKRAQISAQAAGRILTIAVQEGQHVAVGTLLATIEAGPLGDRVAQARAHAAEAHLALSHARTIRDRTRGLVERGIAARQEIDDTETRVLELDALASSANAALSEARGFLAHTRIVAPFSGVVVRVLRRPGEVVDGTAATAVFDLADVATLELVAAVAVRDLVAITENLPATVELEGLATPVPGIVQSIPAAVDALTGAGTIRIRLQLAHTVPLGITGRATVHLGQQTSLVVPPTAVRARPDGSAEVLVCEDQHAVSRAVEIGERAADATVIRSGVTAADSVVRHAVGIEEGVPTMPLAASPSGAR